MSDKDAPQIQNLTRLIWERLENIACYDYSDFIVMCTLTLHTNQKNLKVWEGQQNMLDFSRLKKSAWNLRINRQEADGLIIKNFTRGEIYRKKLRQNYDLIIPPRKYKSCEDWPQHFNFGSHKERTSTKKNREKKKNYTDEDELPDNLNEQFQEYHDFLDFQDRLMSGNLTEMDKVKYFDQI